MSSIPKKIAEDIRSIFKVQDKAKLVKQNISYLAFFYIGNIFTHHVRSYRGGDVIDKIFQAILELKKISYIPSLHLMDLAFGILFAILVKFIVYRLHLKGIAQTSLLMLYLIVRCAFLSK